MYKKILFSTTLISMVCCSNAIIAQDKYEQYTPTEISSTSKIKQINARKSKVLTANLQGIRIVGKPFMLTEQDSQKIKDIQVFSPIILVDNELRKELRVFIGKPLLGADIKVIKSIIGEFAKRKKQSIYIYIPKQYLIGNTLQILASAKPISSLIPTTTSEDNVINSYLGFGNNGSDTTKDERMFLGVSMPSLKINKVDLGAFNYQFSFSPGSHHLRAHTFSWEKSINDKDSIQLSGGYIRSKPKTVTMGFNEHIEGRTHQLSLRYNHKLDSTFTIFSDNIKIFKQQLFLGLDYKHTNNHTIRTWGDTRSRTDINQFILGYSANIKDPWGKNKIKAQWFISPGGGTAENKDHAFAASANVERAESTYQYQRLDLLRRTSLPKRFKLYTKFQYQYSRHSLLASEQMSLGGSNTVRGYEESEISGDRGWMLVNEIRTPFLKNTLNNLTPKIDDQIQFLLFWDMGTVRVNNPKRWSREPNQRRINSVGWGFRYNISNTINIKFDYGYQIKNSHIPGDHRFNNRAHFNVVVLF